MAEWIAILENIVTNNDGVPVGASLILTDQTTQKIPETIPLAGLTLESFKAKVRARLEQLAVASDFALKLPTGPLDLTPAVTPPPVTDPARDAYEHAYRSVERAKLAVDLGIWAPDDPEVVARVADAVKARDASYLDD